MKKLLIRSFTISFLLLLFLLARTFSGKAGTEVQNAAASDARSNKSLACNNTAVLTPQTITHVTENSFKEDVLQSSLPVLVDFWADWSGPNKMIAGIVQDIAVRCNGVIKVAKVNIDIAPDVAPKYNVRGIPTMIFFRKGKPIATKVGAMSRKQYEDWFKKELAIEVDLTSKDATSSDDKPLTEAQYDVLLDAKGLNLPIPVLRAKKALYSMTSGQRLLVIATDPGSIKDFEAFTRQTGNILESSSQTKDVIRILIKKK